MQQDVSHINITKDHQIKISTYHDHDDTTYVYI